MTRQGNSVNFAGTNRFVVDSTAAFGAYTTIQSAVNAAQLAGGGIVVVNPGVYTENVTVTGDLISICGLAPAVAMTSGTNALGAQIHGSFHVDATSNNITFSCQNILFETTAASPAVHFTEGANNIASTWSSCIFGGTTSTAFDCNVDQGTTYVDSCIFNASSGQKCLNLSGAAINFLSCQFNGNDTKSVVSAGKVFLLNCSISDSFDVSNNPGPFLVMGGIQLTISTFSCATIHSGTTVIYANAVTASGSTYLFDGNGPADSGSVLYASLVAGLGATDIDPDLVTVGVSDIPFSTAGTSGTAITGTCRFDSSSFAVDTTGFVSLSGTSPTVWNDTTASGAISVNNGYSVSSGAVSLSLPATAAFGTSFNVSLQGGTSWTITQAVGQSIRFGNTSTTIGVGGSLASQAQGDTISCVCDVANTHWFVESSVGNLTVV